jgi:hypothetical protein
VACPRANCIHASSTKRDSPEAHPGRAATFELADDRLALVDAAETFPYLSRARRDDRLLPRVFLQGGSVPSARQPHRYPRRGRCETLRCALGRVVAEDQQLVGASLLSSPICDVGQTREMLPHLVQCFGIGSVRCHPDGKGDAASARHLRNLMSVVVAARYPDEQASSRHDFGVESR